MTRNEIIGLCGLVLVAVGGAFAAGELNGRINGLGPDRIRLAQDEALRAIDAKLEAFQITAAVSEDGWVWHEDRHRRQSIELIRVDEGICYLVSFAGRFEGHGESVSVVEIGNTWHLRGTSGADGKDVSARAACWRFPLLKG